MSRHHANAQWSGRVPSGSGTMRLGKAGPTVGYNLTARVEEEKGTNPEQMLAAALAGCFSMSLANMIEESGADMSDVSVETDAVAHLERKDDGFWITRIDLSTTVTAPGIDREQVEAWAQRAKATCPVSKLYSSAEISLTTTVT
jgi:osmotically inducible protein OsmC